MDIVDAEAVRSWANDPPHGTEYVPVHQRTLRQIAGQLEQLEIARRQAEEIAELRAQVAAWRKHCDTLTHQVICCGVAASHDDATLTTRGAYAGRWNSAQAEQVRKLRAERDAFRPYVPGLPAQNEDA